VRNRRGPATVTGSIRCTHRDSIASSEAKPLGSVAPREGVAEDPEARRPAPAEAIKTTLEEGKAPMFTRFLAAAGLAALFVTASASAAPVTVQLRVEGSTATIFEGAVTTDGKVLDKGSGPHPCDGTNGNTNPTPGPTMTSALDDGASQGGFSWDGTWFAGFDDFGIDRIGPDSTDFAAGRYWGYALNYISTTIGGCQQRVQTGNEVLFGYDYFSKSHLLKLSGPAQVIAGQSITVTVVDGQTGAPLGGASVGGNTTRSDGRARVTFGAPGLQVLKAERPDSVRSNALVVCVAPVQGGGCGGATQLGAAGGGVADSKAPTVRISKPRSGIRYRRGPRLLRGTVSDEGSGVKTVELSLRRRAGGGCSWWSGARERFVKKGCSKASLFEAGTGPNWSYLLPSRLPKGRYVLTVTAVDQAGNREQRAIKGRTRVTFDVLARRGRAR
jgi:hypothetical protein